MRGMGGTRGPVDEKGLIRRQRFLLPYPAQCLAGEVFGEVVALRRTPVWLYRCRALIESRLILVGFTTNEAIEILKATAAAGPAVERTHRTGFPHRHLVAFAELGRGVAIQFENLGQGRAGVGAQGVVSRSRCRHLGDCSKSHRVVVAAGEQSRSGGGAEGGGVKAVVLEALGRQPLGGGGVHGAAEGGGSAEPHVIKQHNKHVGRASGRAQGLNRRILGVGILGIKRGQALVLPVGNGKHGPWEILL